MFSARINRLVCFKMYKEAEEAYEKVLEIENINDSELDQELFKTRAIQLQVRILVNIKLLLRLCFLPVSKIF